MSSYLCELSLTSTTVLELEYCSRKFHKQVILVLNKALVVPVQAIEGMSEASTLLKAYTPCR